MQPAAAAPVATTTLITAITTAPPVVASTTVGTFTTWTPAPAPAPTPAPAPVAPVAQTPVPLIIMMPAPAQPLLSACHCSAAFRRWPRLLLHVSRNVAPLPPASLPNLRGVRFLRFVLLPGAPLRTPRSTRPPFTWLSDEAPKLLT